MRSYTIADRIFQLLDLFGWGVWFLRPFPGFSQEGSQAFTNMSLLFAVGFSIIRNVLAKRRDSQLQGAYANTLAMQQ